ncbi:MAG: dTDP-4-dehydrorhamnose reductase [Chloroherpetonaceae bacterium]|nr:dTDP-4-dehydrorhamnose reductase [Chloroherpetonaceae bacterium]MCS7212084.1 dTDP-4-dehydrorhamnose reductase [Chloroherpetonaceae bacterium]MDW8020063.1 dTDP-4-dehydrorhamnose reductase [Chloroherpetonaceae bacterium]MDW8465834.1 dTDP-4-dehydrorhamnose reductase [Chloroherpetonaceae bacterium]
MYKRVLITGANGLVGQKLVEVFSRDRQFDLLVCARQPAPYNALASFGYLSLDITQRGAVKELIWNFSPDYIINAAAFTDVDACEREKELSWKANVTAVENLLAGARLVEACVVQISTDYIFDGKAGPYDETALPNPLNYYGREKLAAENAVRASGENWLIVRTNVVYGVAPRVKKNFAIWLTQELKNRRPVTVVDDQYGNPTLADDLARGIYELVRWGKRGVYHIAGADYLSRYEFALKLAEVFGFDKSLITPIKTADLNQLAPRPLQSGLITIKAQSELGINFLGVEESLRIFKHQFMESAAV